MKLSWMFAVSFAVALLATALLAVAFAGVPDPATDPAGFFSLLASAIAQRKWTIMSVLVLIAGVTMLRKLVPALARDRAGALTALVGGVLAAAAGSLLDGVPFGARLMVDAIVIGFGVTVDGVGARQWIRRVIWPQDPAPAPKPDL